LWGRKLWQEILADKLRFWIHSAQNRFKKIPPPELVIINLTPIQLWTPLTILSQVYPRALSASAAQWCSLTTSDRRRAKHLRKYTAPPSMEEAYS
jgi:hypothetical protein